MSITKPDDETANSSMDDVVLRAVGAAREITMGAGLGKQRPLRSLLAGAAMATTASVAVVGFSAHAADRHQKSRTLDKSAARAQALAASAATGSQGSSVAAPTAISPASAASAPSAASSPSAASAPAAIGPRPSDSEGVTTDVALTLGASLTSKATSHVRTTPFLLSVDRGAFHGEFGGDGYLHERGADAADGFGDVSVLAAYNIVFGDLTVQPHFQWTAPSRNAVGSQRAAQEIGLKFKQKLGDQWSFSVTPSVSRDTEQTSRSAEYSRNMGAKCVWQRDDHLQAFVEVARFQPAGDRAGTAVSVEFDFPLFRKIDGSVNLSRTAAGSATANTAEFDLTWSF